MGILSYDIEYRNGASAGTSGRSLGSTGSNKYWSRITVMTDSNGCSSFKIRLQTSCYNGATNTAYYAGAQAIISQVPDNTTYVGSLANLEASHPSNDTTWIFEGNVNYNMLPNSTYYIFVVPVWTASNSFTTSTSSFTLESLADFPTYNLSISSDEHSSVVVNRTFSSYGSTGFLSDGATIYSDDVLLVSYSIATGYEVDVHTLNGDVFSNNIRHVVNNDVIIIVSSKVKSLVYIYDNTWLPYQIYIYNGVSWDLYMMYIYNGDSWQQY